MKFALVSGSHRKDSNSLKVSKYIQKELTDRSIETYLLDLGNTELPLWDEGFPKLLSPWDSVWNPISKELQDCDGVILVTPEYGGMASPNIKNFLLLSSYKELGHKPGLLVGVSAARGGAYPISELRSSGYKNNRICFIPEHLIIRDANNVLGENVKELTEEDSYIRKRITDTLTLFLEYSNALKEMHRSQLSFIKSHPNGM